MSQFHGLGLLFFGRLESLKATVVDGCDDHSVNDQITKLIQDSNCRANAERESGFSSGPRSEPAV
jgi:hypothetical protein